MLYNIAHLHSKEENIVFYFCLIAHVSSEKNIWQSLGAFSLYIIDLIDYLLRRMWDVKIVIIHVCCIGQAHLFLFALLAALATGSKVTAIEQ